MAGVIAASYEADVKPRLAEIAVWCETGVTDAEIAILLDIGATTLSRYKILHEELAEVMYLHKSVFNAVVVRAMAKSALGFEYEEETKEVIPTGRKNPDGTLELALQVTKRVKKFCPPNIEAQKCWLHNREPGDWRDLRLIKVDTDKTFRIVLPEGMVMPQLTQAKAIDYSPGEGVTIPSATEDVIDAQEVKQS